MLRAPATPSEPAAVPDYAENDSGAAIRDDLVHGTTLPPGLHPRSPQRAKPVTVQATTALAFGSEPKAESGQACGCGPGCSRCA